MGDLTFLLDVHPGNSCIIKGCSETIDSDGFLAHVRKVHTTRARMYLMACVTRLYPPNRHFTPRGSVELNIPPNPPVPSMRKPRRSLTAVHNNDGVGSSSSSRRRHRARGSDGGGECDSSLDADADLGSGSSGGRVSRRIRARSAKAKEAAEAAVLGARANAAAQGGRQERRRGSKLHEAERQAKGRKKRPVLSDAERRARHAAYERQRRAKKKREAELAQARVRVRKRDKTSRSQKKKGAPAATSTAQSDSSCSDDASTVDDSSGDNGSSASEGEGSESSSSSSDGSSSDGNLSLSSGQRAKRSKRTAATPVSRRRGRPPKVQVPTVGKSKEAVATGVRRERGRNSNAGGSATQGRGRGRGKGRGRGRGQGSQVRGKRGGGGGGGGGGESSWTTEDGLLLIDWCPDPSVVALQRRIADTMTALVSDGRQRTHTSPHTAFKLPVLRSKHDTITFVAFLGARVHCMCACVRFYVCLYACVCLCVCVLRFEGRVCSAA